jgi:NADH-quinone oxidoreductase subunit C
VLSPRTDAGGVAFFVTAFYAVAMTDKPAAPASATAPAPVAAEPSSPPNLADKLGIDGAMLRASKDGIETVVVPAPRFADAARTLRDQLGFVRFLDLSVVDLVETGREDRFEVYLLVYSMKEKRHARVQATTADRIPSVTSLFAGAHNYEREAFDLFGVHFEGHPSLTRILLPEGWQGHPLRRDAEMPVEPVDFTVTRDLYNT